MREFRSTWPDSALTAQKNLERLRAFFWFCHSAGWVKSNSAAAVKAPRPGKPSERVKTFSEEQLTRILAACERYPVRNAYGHDNRARVRAFVVVLTWKSIRTTNMIENLNREFRRRTKTQASFVTEDAALTMLYGLVAFGQIQLRRIDGAKHLPAFLEKAWQKVA